MAWFKGSTTDSRDMMDILSTLGADEHMSAISVYDGGSGYAIGDTVGLSSGTYDFGPEAEVTSIVTANTVATVASIVSGGTGYAVGDTVAIVGGTNQVVAVLEVLTEAGGVVTSLQINNPGAYSVNPTGTVSTAKLTGSGDDALTVTLTWNTAVAGIALSVYITHAGAATVPPTSPVSTTATSGTGTGLKVNTTWTESSWETLMNYQPKTALSAVVSAGGSGYSVGDLITVNVGSGTAPNNAIFEVATISGSAVATVTVSDGGYYADLPANPASTTAEPSTPGGSGCTLTVTYGGWTQTNYDSYQFLILHNTVEDIYIGIENSNFTLEDADTWRLCPLTGFNTLDTKFSEQPGYYDSDSYIALHDGSFEYTISMDNRKIFFMSNLGSGSTFNSGYMGFFDPFMTEDEYPYPLLVLGMQSYPYKYTFSSYGIGGIPNPGSRSSGYDGPGIIILPGGSPEVFRNWNADPGYVSLSYGDKPGLTPIINQQKTPDLPEERWYTVHADRSYNQIVTYTDTDSTDRDQVARFGSTYVLIPLMISDWDGRRFLGQLPHLYWFDNVDGTLNSGDRIWVGSDAYRVYQNNKKTNKNNFFCVKEA